eukprot:3390920-Prymnesium_polylepis.2
MVRPSARAGSVAVEVLKRRRQISQHRTPPGVDVARGPIKVVRTVVARPVKTAVSVGAWRRMARSQRRRP